MMTFKYQISHGRLLLPFALILSGVLGVGCGKTNAAEKAHDHKKQGKEGHGGHDDHDGDDDHGRGKKGHAAEKGRAVHLGAAQRKEFGVQVATAKSGTLSVKTELTGEVSLNPNRVAHLVPSISGVARKVGKQVGDPVKKDELMACLASRELARLNASYLAAQAKASLSYTEYQREKKLYAKGISSQREFQRAKLAMSKSYVETQLAKRKLLALGLTSKDLRKVAGNNAKRMSHYDLRAPFAGVVVAKHISQGEYLKADTQAFTVADLSDVWVELTVYQKDLPFVSKGQSVEIVAAYGRLKATGKISYVSPLLRRSTRTASARVVLDNEKGQWQPGLFVTATVTTRKVAVPVLVPRSSIQQIEGKPCIFVARGDAFTCQRVTLGRGTDREVAVVKGLRAGTRYVSRGGFVLKSQQNKASFGDGHAH